MLEDLDEGVQDKLGIMELLELVEEERLRRLLLKELGEEF